MCSAWRNYVFCAAGLAVFHCNNSTTTQKLLDASFISAGNGILLISPANNSGLSSAIVFQWSTIAGIGKYRLEIATDAGFANLILQKDIADNSYALLSSDLIVPLVANNTTYYWRVKTIGLTTNLVSGTSKFTVLSLSLNANPKVLSFGKNFQFQGVGGIPPYRYALISGCGSLDITTGIYTAVSSNCSAQIRVTDNLNNYYDGTVKVMAYSNLISSETGLLSYWRMNETNGSTVADIKGGKNGSSAAFTSVAGAIANDSDTAMSFNGTASNKVDIVSPGSFNLQTFSIEFWANESTLGQVAYANIIDDSHGSTNSWTIEGQGNQAPPAAPYGSVGLVFYLSEGIWHHIVITKDWATKTNRLYIDGVLRGLFTDLNGLTYSGTENLAFAYSPTNPSRNWKGSLDEIAFYTTVLTSQQVLDHYNVGSGN